MKLQEIILERKRPLAKSQYKFTVDEKKAFNLIARFCKDSIQGGGLRYPIVRGMRGSSAANNIQIIQGKAGERDSANTTNHYTVILDAVLSPLGFPKRSKSIICANWKNRSHAGGYGTMYAIIPFDGVKIGVCPKYDMWETEITIGSWTKKIQRWNRDLQYMGVDDTDRYQTIVDTLEARAETLEDQGWKYSDETWMKAFLPGKADKALREAYSKPFKLTTTKEAAYNDGEKHEVWIGGKCIAIQMELFFKMMDYNLTEAEIYDFEGGWEPED